MNQPRIGLLTAGLLVTVAGFVDFLQFLVDLLAFIPIFGLPLSFALGIFVDILAVCGFGIWFSALGVSLMNKYPLGFLGTIVLENIPVLNLWPGWTFFVTRTIIAERVASRML